MGRQRLIQLSLPWFPVRGIFHATRVRGDSFDWTVSCPELPDGIEELGEVPALLLGIGTVCLTLVVG